MARQVHPDGDDPLSKVAKLIPAEVSAAFLAVNNLIGNDPKWDDWRVRGHHLSPMPAGTPLD